MDIQPPAKKQRTASLDSNKCALCQKPLDFKGRHQDFTRNPTSDGLKTLFAALEIRKDEASQRLLPFKEDILLGKVKIAFHRTCRATITSKHNLKSSSEVDNEETNNQTSSSIPRLTREENAGFRIRQDCFICGRSKKKGEKLTPISTGTGESTRQKVMSAAMERADSIVNLRMISHPDLFAFDAKYHRSCYAAYLSERNISAARRKSDECKKDDPAFIEIVADLESKVLSKQKAVTTLSQLKLDYGNRCHSQGTEREIFSWKLKERLKKHFGDRLVFIEQRGQSDLVCSSMVTVGDALKKAADLNRHVQSQEEMEMLTFSSENSDLDERSVLHSAAGILRDKMATIKDSQLFYEPSTHINIEACSSFVPDALYNFISWLTDGDSYRDVTGSSDSDADNKSLEALAICHNIISKSRQVRTPITMGLGIYIHHEFGSKQLVENLNSLGHCISYDEVRRFLSSAALDQQQTATYVPRGLTVDGHIIDAAIDNFDKNEDTLDGKATTHAMAAVVYKRGQALTEEMSQLPRIQQKTLRIDQDDDILLRYNKPAKRPEPQVTLNEAFVDSSHASSSYKRAVKRDLLWKVCRRKDPDDEQKVPAWTGFNSVLVKEDPSTCMIRYLPFIQAPPADFTTIFTILQRLVQLSEKLDQSHCLVTADMQIYAKAQEILWAKPPELDGKVTMRLGGMHMTMAFLASLGTIFGDAGLLSMLVDSDVYAEATAKQMLQGKQYSRGIRGMKLVQEALFRHFYAAMESWLEEQGRSLLSVEQTHHLNDLKQSFDATDSTSAQQLSEEIEQDHLEAIQEVIQEFRDVGQEQSETFAFWCMFLDGTDVLLHLLRAEREADFMLHLDATCEALPWFNAAGRRIYAKYVPTYIADMKALEQNHPDSYRHLCQGGFVVRRSADHRFNCVATDQALEQTVNRDGKSKGGVIGLTLRKGALTRWLKTRHVTAEYVESFTTLCNTKTRTNSSHPELAKSRLMKDEEDVSKIVEYLSQCQNPFDLDSVPAELMNISTGQVASEGVRKSLTNCLKLGKQKMNDFIQKRIVQSTKCKSFWDPDTRTKVLTFSDMRKGVPSKKSGTLKSDSEVLFRRLLVVSRKREVSLEHVLQHELAGVPPSLFNDDGTLRKTTKADLAKKLEASCDEIHNLQEGQQTAYIIDGMSMLQGLKETSFNTFDDLGNVVTKKLQHLFEGRLSVQAVVVVFDRYDNPHSIKIHERERRGDDQRASHIISGNRVVPNYRRFMRSSANKSALASFVSTYLLSKCQDIVCGHKYLILAGGFTDGQLVKVLKNGTVAELTTLSSTQEEADTRMLLHAVHMSLDYERIIVRSDDTDVLVLLLYYRSIQMLDTEVFMHAGHVTQFTRRERFIPVNQIVDKLGRELCQNLPAAHALTGCDTTSSLFKIGKRSAFSKLASQVRECPEILTTFGMTDNVEADVVSARRYILNVYGNKDISCTTLDQLRYRYASVTDKAASEFPPTEDAFKQHVLRARYQTSVWLQSHVPVPDLISPDGNGWVTKDGKLVPVMFLKDAAPVEVRDLTHLYCTDTDCAVQRKCHCLQNGLPCIEFCSCHAIDCGNSSYTVQADSDDD